MYFLNFLTIKIRINYTSAIACTVQRTQPCTRNVLMKLLINEAEQSLVGE